VQILRAKHAKQYNANPPGGKSKRGAPATRAAGRQIFSTQRRKRTKPRHTRHTRIDADKFPAHTRAHGPPEEETVSPVEMRKHIHSFCGIFKQKPGEKSVVQEHLDERRAEKEKEGREFKYVGKEIKINWLTT
jgi:hypothetical protein